jgi:hypothetical protein
MFSEPGFWLMIVGAILVAVGFVCLAFNQLGNDMPVRGANPEGQRQTSRSLPERHDRTDPDRNEPVKQRRGDQLSGR